MADYATRTRAAYFGQPRACLLSTPWSVPQAGSDGKIDASWIPAGAGDVDSVASANANIGVSPNTGNVVLTLAAALTGITSVTSSGALALNAGGTNQNITLTPSGTGGVNYSTKLFSSTSMNGETYVSTSAALFANNVYGAVVQGLGSTSDFAVVSADNNLSLIVANGTRNVIIGAGTDSLNGRLQLATHTTAAGGIGFGTDTALYRNAGRSVVLEGSGSTSFTVNNNGNGAAIFTADGLGWIINASSASGRGLLQTANGTTALTLDSSQNATFAGTAITPASVTAKAGLRIPHGTAPTSPVNGDIWTTTAGLFVRINGATVGPLS